MNAEASISGMDFLRKDLDDDRDIDNDDYLLNGPPGGSQNHLKLSVGCADSDDSGGGNEGLNTTMMNWFGARTRNQEFENDFDMEICADRVRSLIQGEQLMFDDMHDGEFPEEVYAPKQPKIKNGYLFGDCIGEGSYAKVKEVVEEYTLVRRAVKIIKDNRLRKIPNGADNVQREIRILKKVDHHNVIRLIETFRDDEKQKLYLVMEFCMGTVQQIMDSSPKKYLSERDAHSFFIQLMDGVAYIHSIGIVHKDIKPGNLLIGSDFVLKISDFGVAEVLSPYQADDSCSIVQGTPKFQAPELVSGNAETFRGFKADIWSCGVTLYNMVSGQYPFEGEAIMILYDNIANGKLIMPENITIIDSLRKLLDNMLNKSPSLRWSVDDVTRSSWFTKWFDEPLNWPRQGLERKYSIYRPLTVNNALEIMYAGSPPLGIILEEPMDYTMTADETRMTAADADDSQAPQSMQPAAHSQSRRKHGFLGCFYPSTNSP